MTPMPRDADECRKSTNGRFDADDAFGCRREYGSYATVYMNTSFTFAYDDGQARMPIGR